MQTVTIDEILDASEGLAFKESHTVERSFREFSIPLEALRLTPHADESLRGDIGLLVGNGIETIARAHWHNKRMTVVTDIPTEVSLHPQHWGTLHLEKAE